jgi:deoxyribodipyrimidine photo-lyase
MRRDLRLADNRALQSAIERSSSSDRVAVAFVFDKNILERLEDKADRRVAFLHRELQAIQEELKTFGGQLMVGYGDPKDVWAGWMEAWKEQNVELKSVHAGRDYEPYAQQRDRSMADFFADHDVAFKGAKDSVILEKNEVTKDDGKPYTVFTPYSRKWRKTLTASDYAEAPSLALAKEAAWLNTPGIEIPTLASMGFEACTDLDELVPPRTISSDLLDAYGAKRDFPAIPGTSRLSLHLRFGTIGIRQALRAGLEHSEKWTTELIWRDFYQMIIYHFPHSVEGSFRPAYDAIPWDNNEAHFEAWCAGKTGYPLVDAGMRELNATGFMHNRVRMVVASFLCKHLLTDWRWGERYFAAKLLDFDLASNVGGWQWASGSGCDAAPYFRVFNPTSQLEKFDKELRYVRKWVPEYGTSAYPAPIVEHKSARQRAIDTYQSVLKPSA